MTCHPRDTIQINGVFYTKEDIEKAHSMMDNSSTFKEELLDFLLDWFSPKEEIKVYTSGSTGCPKEILVKKESMKASALLTCKFLKLRCGDTALLCMPLKYIAGKMMVVRAIVFGLNLIPITPQKNPLKLLESAPKFAAMVPMQVYNSLQVNREKELLKQIKHLLIGGGPIDGYLEEELKSFPFEVFSTYGMTETLSHVALRRLSGKSARNVYTPLEGIKVRISGENTLIINAPHLFDKEIITRDIAEIDSQGNFRILGRMDNTINSGGIKIQIEQVEEALKNLLTQPFMITSSPDKQYGEVVTLLIEGKASDNLKQLFFQSLPPYWIPKHIISVPKLPRTETSKPDRIAAKKIAREHL